MDEIIITDCPICGKSVKAIDSRQEAEAQDIVRCDYNEFYTCYVSRENSEWRYLARRSKTIKPNLENQPSSIKLNYHHNANKCG